MVKVCNKLIIQDMEKQMNKIYGSWYSKFSCKEIVRNYFIYTTTSFFYMLFELDKLEVKYPCKQTIKST